MLLLAGTLDEWLQRLPSLGWGGRAMGLPPSWHGCWSSSWIAPLGSISEPAERRRRSHTSHRPDPAAAEDKVKASVSAPITLNTLYGGSQWPYITSVWSWLDNGPCMFLCVYTSHQLRSKHFSQECICVEKTGQTRSVLAWDDVHGPGYTHAQILKNSINQIWGILYT